MPPVRAHDIGRRGQITAQVGASLRDVAAQVAPDGLVGAVEFGPVRLRTVRRAHEYMLTGLDGFVPRLPRGGDQHPQWRLPQRGPRRGGLVPTRHPHGQPHGHPLVLRRSRPHDLPLDDVRRAGERLRTAEPPIRLLTGRRPHGENDEREGSGEGEEDAESPEAGARGAGARGAGLTGRRGQARRAGQTGQEVQARRAGQTGHKGLARRAK
ncbi:hypothetical protein STTU_3881 [Streptomyces sp. Tu6071]|nr:hypothetical protein STTU_3881 [Streptomyces sp. Tu6071]